MVKQSVKDTPVPVLVSDVRDLEFVDEKKTYYVTVQIGEGCRWRQYSGGRWKRDNTAMLDNPATDRAYVHEPAIHDRMGPFSGRLVNGLIAGHNKWRKLNIARKFGGEIQRQLLVLATEETEDEAIDAGLRVFRFERMIKNIVKETVVATMAELAK